MFTPGILPKPKINSYYKSGLDVVFSKASFDLPKSLPVLTVSKPPPIDVVKAKEIALNLGYGFEPRIVNDTLDGTSYVFDDNKSVLYVRSKTNKVEFHNYIDPASINTNKTVDHKELINNALDFLLKLKILGENEILFSFARYYKGSGSSGELVYTKNKDEASFYEFSFSQKLNGLYIIDNARNSPITVTLLPDGNIYKAEVSILGEVKNSPESYPLKSFEDIKKESNEYTLISVNESDSFLEGLTKTDLMDINIEGIAPAYYRESVSSEIMQPIYLLEGTAKTIGRADAVNILIYTPALQ